MFQVTYVCKELSSAMHATCLRRVGSECMCLCASHTLAPDVQRSIRSSVVKMRMLHDDSACSTFLTAVERRVPQEHQIV